MAKQSEKVIASVWMLDPANASPALRKEIAKWLRRQAYFLASSSDRFTTGRFTARYILVGKNNGPKSKAKS